jgi:drug/metabolite transporter (DMT)-like permease
MHWILIALIPPAIWAITNHIDKFLLGKYFKGGSVGALVLFSSLIGAFILPFILIFKPNVLNISVSNALVVVISGIVYIIAIIPYLYALFEDEASFVVPMFQLTPIFGFILGYFVLGESLTTLQILASLLIITGSISLSVELGSHKPKFKKKLIILMGMSSFFFALYSLLFKYVAIQEDYWITSFWTYIGFVISALFILIFVKSYRQEFKKVISTNRVPVIGLNSFNEIINILAVFVFNYAILLAPLALVWVIGGLQPLFVFIFGILLTVFLPHLGEESLQKKHLIQKMSAIAIIVIGTYIMNLS